MMLKIANVLDPQQLSEFRHRLEEADWSDGSATAGHMAARAKQNLQMAVEHPTARELSNFLQGVLAQDARFISATLPLRILPPRFNRYEGGGHYGEHIDNAIFAIPGSPERVRSDISATLFLSDPADYDGGELIVRDTFGEQAVKLPAGHMVVYPGSSVHRVAPVTRGTRLASFFWVQSLVRADQRRALLWDLDRAIQDIAAQHPDHSSLTRLTGVYHNLIREWSET